MRGIMTIIPAKNTFLHRTRIAAYCRVCTDSAEQKHSFEIQKQYFSNLYRNKPYSELVNIYADLGLSGTKVDSKDKYRRVIWRCNRKYSGNCTCGTPHLTEEQIIEKFMAAFNRIFTERDELFDEFDKIGERLFNTDKLTAQQKELQTEVAWITRILEQLIAENARRVQDQSEYNEKRQELIDRYDRARKKLEKVNRELVDLMARKGAVERFIAELRKQDAPVTEFSDNLWLNTVQSVRVETDGSMMFTFKDGTEVKV